MPRKLAIISYPSDAADDANKVKQAIKDFNDLVDYEDLKFDYLDWNENLSTGRAERGQEVVNEELARCDLILAVFRNRLGTPTGGFASGSVEEVQRFIERPKKAAVDFSVHVFFNDSPTSPSKMVPEEMLQLQAFKAQLSSQGVLYKSYADSDRLEHGVRLALKKYNSSSEPSLDSQTGAVRSILKPDEMDDLGILDAMELGSEAISSASDLVVELGELSSKAAEKIGHVTAKATASLGLTRELINEVATVLIDDSISVSRLAVGLEDRLVAAQTYFARSTSMAMEDFDPETSSDTLMVLASAARGAVDQLDELIRSMQGQLSSSDRLPRLTKELNRAKRASNQARSNIVTTFVSFSGDMKDFVSQIEEYCGRATSQ